MSKPLKATRLSAILIGVLVLMVVVLVGGSIFAATLIMKKSTAAADAQIDADVSTKTPSQLQELKQYLADNDASVQQAAQFAQSVGTYDQSQIVANINNYARTAGVSVTGFDFSGGTSATGTTGTTGTSAVTTPATTATGGAGNGSFGITLAAPIKYRNFITFLKLIENGLMPAQVTNGVITADPENPSTNVTVTSLTIKVAQ